MRALKVLVVVMGVLIVVGTVTLVTLIVQRAGGFASGGGVSRVDIGLDQPEGTRIGGIAGIEGGSGGGLLAVWVTRPDGTERVLLVEPRRGRLAGEIRAGAAPGVPR